MKAFIKSVLMMVSVSTAQIGSASSFATVTEKLTAGEFQIAPGQTQTLTLRNWRYVQKLYVQASAYNRDATVEVITNGDVKGTIYLPGRDPTYVVTIGESTSSIQFRNLSNSWARIYDVTGVMSVETIPVPPSYNPNPCDPIELCTSHPNPYLPARNQGALISSRAIALVDGLESYANYAEYGTYLLPIKKVAARSYAVTSNYGDLSLVSRGALLALKQQIAFATLYLDQTFERDAAFQLAVELTSLGQQLEAVLR